MAILTGRFRNPTKTTVARPKKPAKAGTLRARLAAAQKALRAIRRGDLEALSAAHGAGEWLALEGATLARAMLDQAAEVVLVCDGTGRIVRASKEAQALYGTELVGLVFEHTFPLRHLDGTVFSPVGTADTHRHHSVEAKLEYKGRAFELLVSVGRLKSPGHDRPGSVVTLTDVTERVQAVEKARLEAERLTTTLESITDAFFTVDQAWRFTFINHEGERLLTRSRDELLGRDMWVEFAPAVGTIFHQEYLRAMETNQSVEFEAFYPPLDTWFGVRAYPSAQGLAVYFRDIGERKRAEEVLGERIRLQGQLVHLAASVPGLIYSFELRPDGSTRMPYASGALKDIFDLTPKDVSEDATPALSLIHPDDFGRVHHDITESARTLTPWQSEFRVCRTRRGEIWVEARSVPARQPDGSVLWQGFLQNITERRVAADRLRESTTLLQIVLDHAPARIFWKDRDLRYLGCNTQFANDAGYPSPADLTGKTDFDMSWTEQAESYRLDDMAVLASGTARLGIEEPQTTPDGRTVWLSTSKVPLRGSDDQTIGILGLYQDVTAAKEAALALRESERRFSDLLGNVELVSMMRDRDGRITYCNGYLLALTGWRREDLIGHDWTERFAPAESADQRRAAFATLLLDKKEARHSESEILTRTGERRLIRWSNSVLRSGAGEVTGAASIGEDITEQKRAETKIRHLNRVYSMLSSVNALIVRVHDRDELFRDACQIAVDAGGFRMSAIYLLDEGGTTITSVASAGKDADLLATIAKTLSSAEEASKTMVARAIRERQAVVANDSRRDVRVLFGKQYADAGVRSLAVMPLVVSHKAIGALALYAAEPNSFDAEEMRLLLDLAGDIAFAVDHIQKQARLDYLAYYDALTGLANRSLFLERVAQYVRSAAHDRHTLAVMVIDLDRFKSINESLGRRAGDALLMQVAEWLTHGQGDANLLARIDADHFGVVLPQLQRHEPLEHCVEGMANAFAEHAFTLNDAIFRIGAKFGVALFPNDGADAETLLRNAEAAVEKSKGAGERYLFHTNTVTDATVRRFSLENQLRHALEKDEFVLHYQPIVSLLTGKITGVEALLRWNDPRTGQMPPEGFIRILEDTGLIYDVGRWVVRKAIEDYLRWRALGLPAVRIAVNVSALQLRHRGFIGEIAEAISIDPHAAEGLELEITEGVVMADVALSIATLQSIRALGVTIAIDDFGTGFSSLRYLATLPVDILKVDRSFVTDMTTGPQGLALVSTILTLAHSINLTVVAEGVETEEQARLLRLLGCEEMQGFLVSQPVPVEVFEALFLGRDAGVAVAPAGSVPR